MRTHVANTTKFKLVCFYSHKPDGTPYTSWEKSVNKNRKYHDSYDYEHIKGGITVTRHDKAFDKLTAHITNHWHFIQHCMMFMNDFENQKEILIGEWSKNDPDKNQLCEVAMDKQGNHVICLGVQGGGIRSYPMRVQTIKKVAA